MPRFTLRILAPLSAVALLFVIALASCNRSRPPTDNAPSARGGGGAGARTRPAGRMDEHWVQTPQLKALMARMGQTAGTSTPRNIPDDPERPARPQDLEQAFSDAAVLADTLAAAAAEIPSAVEGRSMSDADRRGFLTEAETLRSLSVQLKQDAVDRRAEAMDRTLTRINATCVTCHSRYRDLSGNLEPRADAR